MHIYFSLIHKPNLRSLNLIIMFLCVIVFSSCSLSRISRGNQSVTLKTPEGYVVSEPKKINFSFEDSSVSFFSRNFAQGDAVYAEITGTDSFFAECDSISLIFGGQIIPFIKKDQTYSCIFSIPPSTEPGVINADIRCSIGDNTIERSMQIKIADAHFKIFKEPLDLGSFSNKSKELSPELLAFIESCTKKKALAFAEMIPGMLDTSLSHPRNMHYITSDFYAKRIYLRYMVKGKKNIRLKDAVNPHNGLDLRGEEGSPIFAMARGKVVFAQPSYYEGNFIILNHGNGIFTYYMHMSKIIAKEGSTVEAGDRIGEVGATGMVTGAHLHVSLLIHGIQADPTSLLWLPIKG